MTVEVKITPNQFSFECLQIRQSPTDRDTTRDSDASFLVLVPHSFLKLQAQPVVSSSCLGKEVEHKASRVIELEVAHGNFC